MKPSKIAMLLLNLTLLFPARLLAEEIEVKAGNVRAVTSSNGSVSVNTGNTVVELPSRSQSSWNNWRYWRLPWQHNCQQSSYQKTTQVTGTENRVVQHSYSSSTCR